MTLKIHNGRVWIGAVRCTLTELVALRPTFPPLPAGIITVRYDGAQHLRSDGMNQTAGPVPWPEADTLIADSGFEAELNALRAAAVPQPTLAEARADALRRVDSAAEDARLAYVTPGSAQAMVYAAKRAEAETWATVIAASGTPVLTDYPFCLSRAARLNGIAESAVTQAQAQAVIDDWAAKITAWQATGIAVEAVREQAKEDIEAAADQAAIDTILAGLVWP